MRDGTKTTVIVAHRYGWGCRRAFRVGMACCSAKDQLVPVYAAAIKVAGGAGCWVRAPRLAAVEAQGASAQWNALGNGYDGVMMMRKRIAWICLLWILLGQVEVPYVTQWMHTVERGWMQLLASFAPFARVSLSSLAYIIALLVVISEVFSRQGRTTPSILNLKRHSLADGGRVLSLVSRAPTNMTVASNDYLQDICFVERRFNGWLSITLVILLLLGPAVYFVSQTGFPAVGIPFAVAAIVLLPIMLRGRLTVGTADGDVTTVLTNKGAAEEVCAAIMRADGRGYHEVSLSSPFSDKTIHMRKSRITGVAATSRFPVLLFLLFLASAFGAYAMVADAPLAILGPVVLLGIVIFETRKQTTAKLIGGHYCFLGSRESTENLLSLTTPDK